MIRKELTKCYSGSIVVEEVEVGDDDDIRAYNICQQLRL